MYGPRTSALILSSLMGLLATGCAHLPEFLQPQSLHKLNRGSSYSEDPFFSVPDETPLSGVAKASKAKPFEITAEATTDD